MNFLKIFFTRVWLAFDRCFLMLACKIKMMVFARVLVFVAVFERVWLKRASA